MKVLEWLSDFLLNNAVGKAIAAFLQGLIDKLEVRNKNFFTVLVAILTAIISLGTYVLGGGAEAAGFVIPAIVKTILGWAVPIAFLLSMLINKKQPVVVEKV